MDEAQPPSRPAPRLLVPDAAGPRVCAQAGDEFADKMAGTDHLKALIDAFTAARAG